MTDTTAPAAPEVAPADLQALADSKSPFRSMTFWGIECGFLGGWLATFAPAFAHPSTLTLIGAGAALLSGEGAILASIGRARATKTLS